ncbi:MAG TPA: hypothetical protein VLK33_08170, partial [Terriglobales bacterium]|nr:hypothetical protein [Terriglobales bacterium]
NGNGIPFVTTNSVNNSFQINTLYTNTPVRGMLVGNMVLSSAVGGASQIDLRYTNNGTGYLVTGSEPLGVAATYFIPFNVPLSTNATFQFISTTGTGAAANVTNAVIWHF